MIANQLGREAVSFGTCFKLSQQALAHVAGATTDGLEFHHNLSRALDDFFGPSTLRSNLLVGGVQATLFIQVADDDFRRVAHITFSAIHVKLPFQMFGKRRAPCQKLFESWGVFFVLELLRFVSRIKIVLKLTAKVHFFKSIAGSF